MNPGFSRRLASRVLGALFFSATAAHAQEVDYGALEAMFGQPVTTSATGSPLQASQVPANMDIITADQIRQSGATNIPDILRYVAGVDVRSYAATDSEVAIRGYSQANNPRLLVLVNGRQVYLDNYGYTAWQSIPVQLADIRQIEIVRGPSSALFGFNAVDGVINIITYDPLLDRTNNLTFGVGTDGTWLGSLVSTLNIPGKAGITAQIGGLKAQEYSLRNAPPLASPADGGTQYGSYAIDGRYKPTHDTEIMLEATQSQFQGLEESPGYDYIYLPGAVSSLKAGISADSAIGITSLIFYINQERDHSFHLVPRQDSSNQVDVLQLSDLVKLGTAHALRIGFEYRNNRQSGEAVAGSLHYNDFAGNAMWNWQLSAQLSFTAAGRIDHLQLARTDPVLPASPFTLADYQHASTTAESYNLGLVWIPTPLDTFRLLTGRAVQAPSLLNYGLQITYPTPYSPVYFTGNPTLKPTVSVNYEIDYDRQLPMLACMLRSALFFNTTSDFMEPAFNLPIGFANGALLAYSQNLGRGQAAGGELGLSGTASAGWRWNLSYSVSAVRDKLLVGPPASPASWSNATPTSAIDFGVGRSWKRWEADLSGHWQSNFNDFSNGLVGAHQFSTITVHNYLTMSGRIGYRLSQIVTLAVAGQQLTGTRIAETSGLEPERRLIFTITGNF